MKSLTLRLPDELHTTLVARAEHTGRSLNSEVCRMLEAQMTAIDAMKVIRETVRQEMRAEFNARRADPVLTRQRDELCGPAAYQRINDAQ